MAENPRVPVSSLVVCDVGVRIVAAGNTCVRCKINAAPMPCWLGTAVAVPFVLDAGHKALEAAREALRVPHRGAIRVRQKDC